jgi:hypothetical protein
MLIPAGLLLSHDLAIYASVAAPLHLDVYLERSAELVADIAGLYARMRRHGFIGCRHLRIGGGAPRYLNVICTHFVRAYSCAHDRLSDLRPETYGSEIPYVI